MKAVWMVLVPFMVVVVVYGLYGGKALPLVIGLVSLFLYVLSLRGEGESIKLTGLVAMFSSIFALWENVLKYLAIIGVALLILLELFVEMRKKENRARLRR
ncbi:hypothetical protein E3E35_06635 [Thermococcus sp. GR7]|uniref:hypothetical protein n=2 Tax=Thermococcus TaxID=2263 RepID=UPI0014318817|nr:hypothetical protein [Thermococcus sp. GR4]NJE47080.1 hypothetical protein [Thermococcus sp. GR7]NJE78095.1 hypothetical protein [Thermococcus sp. GR4]NJF22788.1 hypothetical protein [Thermococcus sp. GR5]